MDSECTVCILCRSKDGIFTGDSGVFIEQIRSAFFTTNKDNYPEEFSDKLKFCVTCVAKLQLSFDLKESYDGMCNKIGSGKCYFCETKSSILVPLDKESESFIKQIEAFLKSVVVCHSYKECSACTKCLYNLSIWFEIRNQLYSIMNVPGHTKEVCNAKVSETPSPDTTSTRQTRNPAALTLKLSPKLGSAGRNTRRVLKKKDKWEKYLKKKLKLFKCSDDIITDENLSVHNLNATFVDKPEDKLFKEIPYVRLPISSQISESTLQQAGHDITVVISDSDDEFKKPKRVEAASSARKLPSKRNHGTRSLNDSGSDLPRKAPFKIKFSLSFSKSLELKNKYLYTCSVCDKGFSIRCDYLLHLLRHEKMESLIVNVVRMKLPPHLKANDFSKHSKNRGLSLPSKHINKLLAKWVGGDAATMFDDSEVREGSDTDDMSKVCNGSKLSGDENADKVADDGAEKQVDENMEVDTVKESIESSRPNDVEMSEDVAKSRDVEEKADEGTESPKTNERKKCKPQRRMTISVDRDAASNDESEERDEANKGKKEDDKLGGDATENGEDIDLQSKDETTDAKNESYSSNESKREGELNEERLSDNNDSPSEREDESNLSKSSNRDSNKNDQEGKHGKSESDESEKEEVTIREKDKQRRKRKENSETDESSDDDKSEKGDACENDSKKNARLDKLDDTSKKKRLSLTIRRDTKNQLSVNKDGNKSADNGIDDDFASDDSTQHSHRNPVMTSEDLLSILETNMDESAENVVKTESTSVSDDDTYKKSDLDESSNHNDPVPGKRKREDSVKENDSDSTPKRKRVRFANEKEIVTPDSSVVLREKLS